jgi:hypothetical protein
MVLFGLRYIPAVRKHSAEPKAAKVSLWDICGRGRAPFPA